MPSGVQRVDLLTTGIKRNKKDFFTHGLKHSKAKGRCWLFGYSRRVIFSNKVKNIKQKTSVLFGCKSRKDVKIYRG